MLNHRGTLKQSTEVVYIDKLLFGNSIIVNFALLCSISEDSKHDCQSFISQFRTNAWGHTMLQIVVLSSYSGHIACKKFSETHYVKFPFTQNTKCIIFSNK